MDYQFGGNFRLSEITSALALVGIERFINIQVIVKELTERI